MIFNLIVSLLTGVFTFILNLFPAADPTIADYIEHGVYNFKELLAGWNWIFPVDTFYTLATALLGLLIAGALLKLVRWIGSILTANLFH